MKEFKNILFVSQGLTGNSDSLEQALTLSNNNHASLMGIIICPSLPENMSKYEEVYEKSLLENLDSEVKQCVSKNNQDDRRVFPIKIASGDKPAIKVIKTVLNDGCDLLIKDAEPLNEGSEGFKALDMKLLRKSPCAIWLNRPSPKDHAKKRVAVAIDPIVEGPEGKKLALQLLEVSRSIADSCDSQLHVISCWEYELENYLRDHSWIQVDEERLNAEIESVRSNHREILDSLIIESGISGEITVHHINGRADDEIPQCVANLEIDILAMGTIARTGIKGLVMGNTAENVLQSIKCSLVALKPEGFISPIH
ncbi:universal stress protein [Vibrio sp. 404]|uniref:Universal stress protein n=1 Tax=Vibrio marinisediminis TaxID=2758441 RepID=A0A7W2FN20_9VIBR|nr:universal stress protein [Vibrio marinisediminis]MBA5761029.1 universal stress protein [Vibrio marinisediminis]